MRCEKRTRKDERDRSKGVSNEVIPTRRKCAEVRETTVVKFQKEGEEEIEIRHLVSAPIKKEVDETMILTPAFRLSHGRIC